jgi:hypothetical protein
VLLVLLPVDQTGRPVHYRLSGFYSGSGSDFDAGTVLTHHHPYRFARNCSGYGYNFDCFDHPC